MAHDFYKWVYQSRNDPSCFALPGSGGIPATYCDVDLQIQIHVDDYLNVTGRINAIGSNGLAYHNSIVPNVYPVEFYIRSQYFWIDTSQGWPGMVGGGYGGTLAAEDVNVYGSPTGVFNWMTGWGGWVNMGHLSQLATDPSGRWGSVWIGGTGVYSVNDPIYPGAIQIIFDGDTGDGIDIPSLLDYYPGAISKSAVWQSHNRKPGGFAGIYKSAAWRDIKNQDTGSDNKGFIYLQNGTWKRLAKIGNNS